MSEVSVDNRVEQTQTEPNHIVEIISNPTRLPTISAECPIKKDITLQEWEELRATLITLQTLITRAKNQPQTPDGRYDFRMGIGYTHIFPFQSKEDPNLTCVIRNQPIPKQIKDFKYTTGDVDLPVEQTEKSDLSVTLRYRTSETSWVCARFLMRASPDHKILAADPTKTQELSDRNMDTDLDYMSGYKPFYLHYWMEQKKPDSEMKETGLIIPGPEQFTAALSSLSNLDDFQQTMTRELGFFFQRMDDGEIVPEIKNMLEEVKNPDNRQAYEEIYNNIVDLLKNNFQYHGRSEHFTAECIQAANDCLRHMEPKKLEASDLMPPHSLHDFQAEEWAAYEKNVLLQTPS